MVAARKLARSLASLSVVALIAGCGGGGGDTAVSSNPDNRCEPCVLTGFVGDLDWELAHNPGATGLHGGDGVGAGGDGDGGVGAGGSLGQFRRALVVARFADGQEIGRALTDDVAGMVTIRPGRTYAGPILVEIHGQDGATYFEEGKNVPVPFEAGRVLRAVVPVITRNIGITPFSEAAYQLAMLCQSGSGPAEVCPGAPAAGNATVPGAPTITSANGHVTALLNQQMPNALRVDDVTRLPNIVGTDTPAESIKDTPRGRYGLANIAFSKQAAMFNTAEPAPTLLATEQLSRDLLDGRLDGVSAGTPLAAAGRRTYDPHSLTSEISAALAQQTTRYGDTITRGLLPSITAFGNTRYDSYYFDATLEPSGATSTIAVATESESTRRAPGQRTVYAGPGKTDERGFMLYSNMGSGALFIKTDAPDSTSTILAIGDNRNGELGDGSQTATGSTSGPARIALPGVLTHAAGGIAHTVARLADGSVWTWGDNSLGQLGQGQPAASLPRSSSPLRVTLPRGATAVAASNQASFALLEDGSVWSWGSGWGFGTLGDNSADGRRIAPAPVQSTSGPLTGVIQLAARDNDAIALKADGSVLTWGSFTSSGSGTGPTGIAPGRLIATPIAGLPRTTGGVRKVLTEQGLFAVLVAGNDEGGNDVDGAVYSWGVHFDITANTILEDRVPRRVLNLPPVRDLMPGGFLGYGQRPADRLTGMAIDYDGRLWKTRGRVAEQYDPANPTAQRRPQGQINRPDCDTCHVIRPKTLPPVPTTGPTCVVPPTILSLLTSQSRCENCHNSAPLSGGRVLGPLTCVPQADLPSPQPPIVAPPRTERCALPVAHPVIQTNAACSSCHNSVVTATLACSPDLTPLAPPSTTTVIIDRILDNVGPITGSIANGGVTDDTTPTLEGRTSAPLVAEEYVTILRDGQPLGQATATVGASSWQFTAPEIATGSTATFTGRIDRNGASSGASGAGFVVQIANQGPNRFPQITEILDDVAPNTGNMANGVSNDPSPTIVATIQGGLTGSESVRFERVRDNGAAELFVGAAQSPDRWVLQENGLADGSYRYRAQAIGPSGAGAFSNPVTLRVDTQASVLQPTLQVQVDEPNAAAPQIRSVVLGTRANGQGIGDPTPTLVVQASGAAAGDRVEFQMATSANGGFTALPGASIVDLDARGVASVTPTIPGVTAVLGTANAAPSQGPMTVRWRARIVDQAGNAGPWSAESSHALGLFGCMDLKRIYTTHVQVNDTGAPTSCGTAGCHTQSGAVGAAAVFQRVPAGAQARYWCSFNTAASIGLSFTLFRDLFSTQSPDANTLNPPAHGRD